MENFITDSSEEIKSTKLLYNNLFFKNKQEETIVVERPVDMWMICPRPVFLHEKQRVKTSVKNKLLWTEC
jgi:hypothetical protein